MSLYGHLVLQVINAAVAQGLENQLQGAVENVLTDPNTNLKLGLQVNNALSACHSNESPFQPLCRLPCRQISTHFSQSQVRHSQRSLCGWSAA